MRLINTKTLELHEFVVEDGLRYAILSHRWEKDEVLFADTPFTDKARSKQGFAKIEKFCELANAVGYEYAWVDTCCIDKSSSAELSEAINSMFRWYQNAAVCFAYLFDVGPEGDDAEFVKSEWFRRGWTMQELIAPAWVYFFDQSWQSLGSKHELIDLIQKASGIEEKDAINGGRSVHSFSIAERMSWASKRVTTRLEDIAYCLLGIFDVNMPLLYGEGNKAFLRMQKQIIEESNDRSIFAWQDAEHGLFGLLANNPMCFARSGKHMVRRVEYLSDTNLTYNLTNYGISISLRLWPWTSGFYVASIYASPPYQFERYWYQDHFCILLARIPDKANCYVRVTFDGLHYYSRGALTDGNALLGNDVYKCRPSIVETVNVHHHASLGHIFRNAYRSDKPMLNWVLVDHDRQSRLRLTIEDVHIPTAREDGPRTHSVNRFSLGRWDGQCRILRGQRNHVGRLGRLSIEHESLSGRGQSRELIRMLLGINSQFQLICVVSSGEPLIPRYQIWSSVDFNDVSTKRIEQITCLEDHGWPTQSEVRPGLQAVKMNRPQGQKVVFSVGRPNWLIQLDEYELERCWIWRVRLGLPMDQEADKRVRPLLDDKHPTSISEQGMMSGLAEYVLGDLDADNIPVLDNITKRTREPAVSSSQIYSPQAPDLMTRYFDSSGVADVISNKSRISKTAKSSLERAASV